mgnify:CR=1 FL=1
MVDQERLEFLRQKAQLVRKHIVQMVTEANSGHPGGSLSAADLLTALYFQVMRINPEKPDWPERDRFILSKGHASPVLYAVLAERGYFPVEELSTFRKINSRLQGHPDMKKLPGVEMSTGSLGQGLSVANGMALAGKLDNLDYRVYVLLGDGEIEEGQVWEAAMTSAHYKLDNLIAVVDYNGLQIDGPVSEVMNPGPLQEKWRAFGWHVFTIDGHDFKEILATLEAAREIKGKPVMIIANTIKGKGVSFMENKVEWHGTAPSKEQFEQAISDLS